MTKYLLKRLLHGLFSVVAVVALVMMLIYSLMDRNLIFANDPQYTKLNNNIKKIYQYQQWKSYGYIEYDNYDDFISRLHSAGEISDSDYETAKKLGRDATKDSATTKKYVQMFTDYYDDLGWDVTRLNAISYGGNRIASGGDPKLVASRDIPLLKRLWDYFTGLVKIDDINYASEISGERGLTFTLHDPLYNGSFSPAIIGNGTEHKYLLYLDSQFPYIHQNIIQIKLGTSYSVKKGVDVFDNITTRQGSYVMKEVTFPTGLTEMSADDLHTAKYIKGSQNATSINSARFVDDYTNVDTYKSSMSRIGFSFVIGIISVIIAYLIGIPVGVIMARKKDKLIDKIGTVYVIFIIAVPSLAYIFLFKAIGGKLGLPTTFITERLTTTMYILPIISLSLPSIASLMRWLRRYMIDQMNSDYVKFARSGGLTENEIFTKHILKNAAIPIIHGIPGSILGSLTGAIITERVYVVPGAGNLLTTAINSYDNGVIVGITLFYAMLSIISIILGDILMATVDPRISYTTKSR
ncbi:MAG: ABC transporter permease [Erysipelotrichaceae bacterium]|nr:ABC transporter permease [Erysipelotrichaceae bacterium]